MTTALTRAPPASPCVSHVSMGGWYAEDARLGLMAALVPQIRGAHDHAKEVSGLHAGLLLKGGGSSWVGGWVWLPPLCDIPSGCCSFTGPWTVTRSSLRMLRRVAAFCRPLRPVLLLVSFPRSRGGWVWLPPPHPRVAEFLGVPK